MSSIKLAILWTVWMLQRDDGHSPPHVFIKTDFFSLLSFFRLRNQLVTCCTFWLLFFVLFTMKKENELLNYFLAWPALGCWQQSSAELFSTRNAHEIHFDNNLWAHFIRLNMHASDFETVPKAQEPASPALTQPTKPFKQIMFKRFSSNWICIFLSRHTWKL